MNFNVYESKEKKGVEWPSLLGPDKVKLLKLLPDKNARLPTTRNGGINTEVVEGIMLNMYMCKVFIYKNTGFLFNIQRCYGKITNFTTQFKGIGK